MLAMLCFMPGVPRIVFAKYPFFRVLKILAKGIGDRKCTWGDHIACRYVAFRVPCIKPAKEDAEGWISPTRLVVYSRRRNTESEHPERVATAHTLLLEVSGDLWKGGRAAEKQVAAKIATALAPHRKANASHLEPHDCFTLRRCCECGSALPPFFISACE